MVFTRGDVLSSSLSFFVVFLCLLLTDHSLLSRKAGSFRSQVMLVLIVNDLVSQEETA